MKHLMCLLVLLAIVDRCWSAEVIKLGTKVEWSPYHIDAPDGADGLAVRLVACIMARINQPFIIEKKPWKRVQYETSIGQLDGFFAASKNEVRDEYASQSDEFISQQRVFYLKKSTLSKPLDSYDLAYIREKLTVAARAGSNALHSLQQEQYQVIVTPQTQEQLVNILDQGRVGAVLENSSVFTALIKRMGRSMKDYHAVVHKQKNMGVYFSHNYLKQHPGFLAKFNRNIAPCLANVTQL